jgi:hypothetical protein
VIHYSLNLQIASLIQAGTLEESIDQTAFAHERIKYDGDFPWLNFIYFIVR